MAKKAAKPKPTSPKKPLGTSAIHTDSKVNSPPADNLTTSIVWNEEYIPHKPTAKQLAFLMLPHKEAFYGGAAGGGVLALSV